MCCLCLYAGSYLSSHRYCPLLLSRRRRRRRSVVFLTVATRTKVSRVFRNEQYTGVALRKFRSTSNETTNLSPPLDMRVWIYLPEISSRHSGRIPCVLKPNAFFRIFYMISIEIFYNFYRTSFRSNCFTSFNFGF